jgi:hypothetical protein
MRIAFVLASCVWATTKEPLKFEQKFHEAYRHCYAVVATDPSTKLEFSEPHMREGISQDGFKAIKNCVDEYLRK